MSLHELHRAQRGLISQNTYLEIGIHSVQEDTTGPAVKTVLQNITVVTCSKFALWKTVPLALKQLRHQRYKAQEDTQVGQRNL